MRNSSYTMIVVSISAMLVAPWLARAEGPYEPDWRSLKRHQTPQWLSDAKFGIYTHWPQPSDMEDAANYTFDGFNAVEWADLFEKAGAQFAGPVAIHCRGYALWDNSYTDFNSVKTGPKKDIVGELEQEIKKRGMKFFMSFHRPSDKQQEELQGMVREAITKYKPDVIWFDVSLGGTLDARNWGRYVGGKKIYGKDNLLLTKEPSLPSGGVKESVRKDFLAWFYNWGIANNKDVEVIYKEYDLPPGVGMRDIENGRMKDLAYDEWMNDIDIFLLTGAWWYEEAGRDVKYKSAKTLIHELVDCVSKNGRVVLNVGPMRDGSFSDGEKEHLLAIGDWLRVNGEAIYGTTVWMTYGEGPTELRERDLAELAPKHDDFDFGVMKSYIKKGTIQAGHYTQAQVIDYQPTDVRFTVKGNAVYAICLGWPGKSVTIETLGSRGALKPGEVKSVHMLGVDRELEWTQTPKGLIIHTPDIKPCKYAYAFKVERQ